MNRANYSRLRRRKRGPLQPEFTLWPWGVASIAAPLAAFTAAVYYTVFSRSAFPSWLAAVVFYIVLGGGNGALICSAIGERAQRRMLIAVGAVAGAVGCFVFYSTRCAAAFALFLLVFAAVRGILRFGSLVAIFCISVGVTAVLSWLVVRTSMSGTVYFYVSDPLNQFLFGTLLCYPWLCASCTSCLPGEATVRGTIDAALTGLRSSLYGMFCGYAAYLAVRQLLEFVHAEFVFIDDILVVLIATMLGVAVANGVCVWQLFGLAMLARPDDPPAPTRVAPAVVVTDGDSDVPVSWCVAAQNDDDEE